MKRVSFSQNSKIKFSGSRQYLEDNYFQNTCGKLRKTKSQCYEIT